MMQEDKLTHDERLRLECLNQAVTSTRVFSIESVIDTAKEYEKFVSGGRSGS